MNDDVDKYNDTNNSPKKKGKKNHRSSSDSSPPHDNSMSNRIHNPDEGPAGSTLFIRGPLDAYGDSLNQTLAAQRQVKAARPPQDDISSDEDEDENPIPVNSSGKKRRNDADEEYYTRGDDGQGRVNRAPRYDPRALNGLSPEQLSGTVSTIGEGPSTPTPPAQAPSATDPRNRYLPGSPWGNAQPSSLTQLGPTAGGALPLSLAQVEALHRLARQGPNAGGGPPLPSPSSPFSGSRPGPNTQPGLSTQPVSPPTPPAVLTLELTPPATTAPTLTMTLDSTATDESSAMNPRPWER
ncbi:MAG: hypothetical protein Q9226_003527 [Calogaya cf. arnoldii]